MSARPALGCRRPDSIRPRSDCPPLMPRCPRSPVRKLVTSCAHCSPVPSGSSELDSLLFSLALHFLGAFLPPGERAPQAQGPCAHDAPHPSSGELHASVPSTQRT